MNNEEKILKLNHGDKYIIPESDYGKAEVWFINNAYILFEIPLFGGEPIYYDTYSKEEIETLIKEVESWT